MIEFRELPNQRRNFVHKRLIRAATGFVSSGFNPLSAASSFLRTPSTLRIKPPGVNKASLNVARKALNVVTKFNASPVTAAIPFGLSKKTRHRLRHKAQKAALKLGLPDPGHGAHTVVPESLVDIDCIFPLRRDPRTGECKVFVGEQSGRDDTPIGDTVMGKYGAGEVPGSMVIDRAICRPGMVLGDDGFCYNRSQLKNSEREWPRGRRPLLTGGDMRAISVAARAGKRLEGATKRLQKIGLMKKPAPRQKRITSGSTEHHHHS